jgi:(S)-ureidoglycine aminohydrolase
MPQQEKLMVVNEADLTSRCRAVNKPGIYGLLPAANRVFHFLPELKDARIQVLATPQMGARFTEHVVFVDPNGGTARTLKQPFEGFFYVLEGGLDFTLDGRTSHLEAGSFVWQPPDVAFSFRNPSGALCRMLWIRRRYVVAEGLAMPDPIISHVSQVEAEPVDTYMEAHLTPYYADLSFDMGINLQTFDQGVYFPYVESHIMEHGLYMTEGRGIYWLNGDFLETQKDDFIFMAPYCPQYFYATGWDKSAYLLYKDVNRDYLTTDW